MGRLTRHLFGILGKRAFLIFGVVTFLVAALLATVNITSRYALKRYVDDQLERTPWDLVVYQAGPIGSTLGLNIPEQMRSVEAVREVENLVFLRAMFPRGGEAVPEVDGKPLGTPWVSMLAATDARLLPPELQLALGDSNGAADGLGYEKDAAVLALVGPEQAIGQAFLALQGARQFGITIQVAGEKRSLFTTSIRGVIRLSRDELNRWFMDQIGSIAFVPHIGIILLMPYQSEVLRKFDLAASGLVPPELIGAGEAQYGHIAEAEYMPEMAYLGRVDRRSVISGWDIGSSLRRMADVRRRVHRAVARSLGLTASAEPDTRIVPVHDPGQGEAEEDYIGSTSFVVDSTTLVLLERMNGIARLIGVVTLLVAFPLLWMAWVLAANLSGLLMLNERRKLGLMRLRGIPGRAMGRAFLLAISSGGLLGGVLGVAAGSVIPLLIYERGRLLAGVLTRPEQVILFLLFLLITLLLAFLVSWRLVRYASTISPLEASGRVASSEASRAAVRFGPLQAIALLFGVYTLTGWTLDFSLSATLRYPALWFTDRILDFIGLPLFLYGAATLLVSRKSWIQTLLDPLVKPMGGRLGMLALKHISVKPHRTVSFLLIVALMASVSLYPTVASRSFEEKAVRGARVQIGTEWRLTLNAPDLAGPERFERGLASQHAALRPGIERVITSLARVEGVQSVTYMLEALLPSFYLRGYGFRGVPLYLLGDPGDYLGSVYSEPELGISFSFGELIERIKAGEVAVSPPVADFWRLEPGTSVLLGRGEPKATVFAPTAGVMAFLPGTPPRTVTDRQGYVQARVDYLNYLFSNTAYLVAAADNPKLSNLEVLIPRIIVLVKMDEAIPPASAQAALVRALPYPPLEVHNLGQEVQKVGSDMFISLALENMRIYLLGGLLLALIAILAVALANYTEDRRTFALLRIRGASPAHIWRFIVAVLLSPAMLGLILGALAALVAGYGLTNYVWKLRELKTVVQLLPTHLVISSLTMGIALLLLVMLVSVTLVFSFWVFRRTARENIQEG